MPRAYFVHFSNFRFAHRTRKFRLKIRQNRGNPKLNFKWTPCFSVTYFIIIDGKPVRFEEAHTTFFRRRAEKRAGWGARASTEKESGFLNRRKVMLFVSAPVRSLSGRYRPAPRATPRPSPAHLLRAPRRDFPSSRSPSPPFSVKTAYLLRVSVVVARFFRERAVQAGQEPRLRDAPAVRRWCKFEVRENRYSSVVRVVSVPCRSII